MENLFFYYVNKYAEPTGEHKVHQSGCDHLPSISNLVYLGEFDQCADAIREAEKYFIHVNGCTLCCKECHTP